MSVYAEGSLLKPYVILLGSNSQPKSYSLVHNSLLKKHSKCVTEQLLQITCESYQVIK